MAIVFPTIGVVEDFNRADGAAGGNWSQAFTGSGFGFDIATNTAKAAAGVGGGQYGGAYWNPIGETFGDIELKVDSPTMPGGVLEYVLHWHAKNVARNGPPAAASSTWSGYELHITATAWEVKKYDGTTNLTISNSQTRTNVAGDAWGIRHIEGVIYVIVKGVADTEYQLLATYDDATYRNGWGGWEAQGTVWRADNFAFGNYAPISFALTNLPDRRGPGVLRFMESDINEEMPLQITGDVAGVLYPDADTVTVFITPSSVDTADYVESNTVYVDIQVATADIAQYVDQNTVGMVITPSSVDTAQYVESATVQMFITPSSADIAAYVDQQTVGMVITPSSVDTAQYVDQSIVQVFITPITTFEEHATYDAAEVYYDIQLSSVEEHTTYDADTVYYDIQVATADIAQYVDQNTCTVVITPSSSDIAQYVESNTVYYDIQVVTADIAQYVESATIPVVITPSSVDTAQYVESAQVYYDIQLSSVEIHEIPDAATVSMLITPSSVDTAQYVESAQVYYDIDVVTTFEEHATYDTATCTLIITPSSVDTAQYVEANTVTVVITPGGTEVQSTVGDANTVYVLITPSTTVDIAAYVDAATVPILITVTSVDISGSANLDAATIYIDIRPVISTQLVAIMYTRFGTRTSLRFMFRTHVYTRFDAKSTTRLREKAYV